MTELFEAQEIIGKFNFNERAEAIHYDGTAQCADKIKHWVRNFGGRASVVNHILEAGTITGSQVAKANDWVINLGNRKFLILPNVVFNAVFTTVPAR